MQLDLSGLQLYAKLSLFIIYRYLFEQVHENSSTFDPKFLGAIV